LLGFGLAWFLKEVPLRGSTRAGTTDVGDGFGMPEHSDRVRRLELAIGRLSQKATRDDLIEMWRESGSRLAVADGWCLAQVHVREKLGVPPTLESIAVRVRVPQEVLAPAFAACLRRGYLVDDHNVLTLTDTGRQEVALLVKARRVWLARELSDWGADDDALLGEALDNTARKLLDESTELEPV
jgi:hypothetical protein